MTIRQGLTHKALTSMIALAAGLVATAATAQTAAAPAAPASDQTADVIVTGSRIARPNLESTSPVTSISATELKQTGNISIGDTLNNLPALASTISQSNSTRFLGTAGLNLLDLRGLGTQRTLVLVNGRRHVAGDILNNAVSPDINTFPTDLIDRVDVVTGGDSAIYGSDAIAGVVNFVLKDHFQGVQLHVQGDESQHADAQSYYASILAGKNFGEGRGNVAINLEYARQNDLYASQRSYYRENDAFVPVDTDPAGSPNGSDGNPDNVFFHDLRSATLYSGGLISFFSPNGACGRDNQGRAFTCNYIFNPDGTLTPETGTRVGLNAAPGTPPTSSTAVTGGAGGVAPGGNFIGGNGNTRREGRLFQLLPQLTRYSANVIGHYEISNALVPFVEASFVRTNSFGTGNSGPAFFTGSTLDGLWERPRLDNPFLSQQAHDVIVQQLVAGGVDPTTITGATRFILRKNLTDLGDRAESARRDTYRAVVGLRGDIGNGWHYEASANYGQFDEHTKVQGNLNVQRFLLGMDTTRNAQGQIVCRGVADPALGGVDIGGNPQTLANDIASCVPINPFGDGNISQAAKDYVLQDTVSFGKITQFVASAFLSGDTRNFLNLPGGPVGVAVGAEYRRETAFFQEDALVNGGYTFYNAIPTFDPPSFEVKEAYAELRVPVLADMKFAHELTVSGAARLADYKGSTGSVWSYNGGIDYSPVKDIRFRANYSRAVRAPNLVDLYTPLGQNFSPAGFTDPCAADQLGAGTASRAANCAAAGRPANYNFQYSQSLQLLTGGNPDLKAETSDSWTYGVVLTPSFARGLALSVDYYKVRVNKVITQPTPQQIVNSCYDSPTTDNQFCGLFQRAGAGGGPNGEEPFRIIEGSLQQISVNYAKFQSRGLDIDLSYNRTIGGVNLSSHFIWTHSLQQDQFIDPTQPGFANRIQAELGQPKDAFNWNIGMGLGRFQLSTQLRYLSPMAVSPNIEDTQSVQGRPPQNADFSDTAFFPSVFYVDVRGAVNLIKGISLYGGIDNLTDRKPPLGATGLTQGSAIYETIGRRFYAGLTAKF